MERPVTSHPVITTVTIHPDERPPVSETPGVTFVQITPGFFKTWRGFLLLVQLLLAVICMACASPAYRPGTSWFLFVVVICFIVTLMWVFIHLLSITNNLNIGVSWLTMEFGYSAGATVLYFTAFIVQLSIWSPNFLFATWRSSNIAAGVFALFNFLTYGVLTFLLHQEKQNQPK